MWTNFEWADPSAKDVIFITSQLDTGSLYTYLEGGTFKKFMNKFPSLANEIKRVDTAYNGNWYKIAAWRLNHRLFYYY